MNISLIRAPPTLSKVMIKHSVYRYGSLWQSTFPVKLTGLGVTYEIYLWRIVELFPETLNVGGTIPGTRSPD